MNLKKDAKAIFLNALQTQLPEKAVINYLKKLNLNKRFFLLSVGKAAYRMAKSAKEYLGEKIFDGVVITKYGHSEGNIEGLEIFEAGHPILDDNGIKATEYALDKINKITDDFEILFLVSGGGSALFEKPLKGVTLNDLINLNESLLKSGADIVKINTVRKHLSSVKGGRFAEFNRNRKIHSLILSDVLGNDISFIASGPTVADSSTSDQCIDILSDFNIFPKKNIIEILKQETPKKIENADNYIIGSIEGLIEQAKIYADKLGYFPIVLSSNIICEASEAGKSFADICVDFPLFNKNLLPVAIITGGESVVKVHGKGVGGRCQEMCLAFLDKIKESNIINDFVFLSCGSDGTDGPTDAAGGIIDMEILNKVKKMNLQTSKYLDNNDSYSFLNEINGLIKTGPTGTNVNDIQILLIK